MKLLLYSREFGSREFIQNHHAIAILTLTDIVPNWFADCEDARRGSNPYP